MIGNLAPGVLIATATVATQMPDAKSGEAIGWWLIVAVCVLVGADKALDFFKKHVREQPTPSNTYLTIPNFDRVERERKEDREKIFRKLEEIADDLVKSTEKQATALVEANRYQAVARQKIHGRLNRQENALYYIAGKEEAAGNNHAARVIRERLESKTGGADDEG